MYNVIFCTLHVFLGKGTESDIVVLRRIQKGKTSVTLSKNASKISARLALHNEAALILNFKGVFMCNGKGSNHQPD